MYTFLNFLLIIRWNNGTCGFIDGGVRFLYILVDLHQGITTNNLAYRYKISAILAGTIDVF